MRLTGLTTLGAIAILLAGCADDTPQELPFGAPPPDHNDMTFVDLDGCRWWVIGNALNRTWAPQRGPDGKHICRDDGVPTGAAATAAPEPAPQPQPVQTAAAPSANVAPTPEPAAAPAPEPTPAPEPVTATPGAVVPTAIAPAAATEAATPADPEPAAPAPAPNVADTASGPFFVQVAAFKSQSNADTTAANFIALGFPVAGDPAEADANGLYGLTLGPFQTGGDANAALAQARTEGFGDAYIRRR